MKKLTPDRQNSIRATQARSTHKRKVPITLAPVKGAKDDDKLGIQPQREQGEAA